MSVKIIEFNLRENFEGEAFFALTLQGGVEIVKSANGGTYVTIRKCSLPTTFDDIVCQSLIGTELPGTIEKVECEPYTYNIPETGEVVQLHHRYEYREELKHQAVDFTKVYTPSANGVNKPETV